MDLRHTLIAVVLSFVELLEPSYFVFENVPNAAMHRLCGQETAGVVTGGIDFGLHKFIMRTSLDLG